MSYTEEDSMRSIAQKSNGHTMYFDKKLHRISSDEVRKDHLKNLAERLKHTKEPGLANKAAIYIDGLLDKHPVDRLAKRKELETMKKNGTIPTLLESEKGFFGSIKRKVRQVKDFFKPSPLKIIEKALAPVARDIARHPEQYPYENLESAFKANNIEIPLELKSSIERSNYELNKEHKRELRAKIRSLRSSSPEKKSAKQANLSREQSLSMMNANGGR